MFRFTVFICNRGVTGFLKIPVSHQMHDCQYNDYESVVYIGLVNFIVLICSYKRRQNRKVTYFYEKIFTVVITIMFYTLGNI